MQVDDIDSDDDGGMRRMWDGHVNSKSGSWIPFGYSNTKTTRTQISVNISYI